MSDRHEKPVRDRTQVTPDAKRPDLFGFLEKLFAGDDQKADKIELRQAFGPGARQYAPQVVWQKEFKANAAKPTKEQLVALSNEFLDYAQTNCNAIGKPHKYGVLAKHLGKSDTYYSVFLLALAPTQQGAYDPLTHDEDDESITSDGKRRDNLLQFSLEHMRQSDENERWRQDQFSKGTGDLLERYQSMVSMLMAQNLEMHREHRELFKTADEALSRKSERDLAAESQKFRFGMMQDAFVFLKQMAPVVVNTLQGRAPGPTEQSAESIAVRTFLEGLTEAQGKALFGEIIDGKATGNGIFTPEQVEIFFSVADCKRPASALEALTDGEYAVTQEQIEKVPNFVSPQQFMPLVALIMQKKKKELSP